MRLRLAYWLLALCAALSMVVTTAQEAREVDELIKEDTPNELDTIGFAVTEDNQVFGDTSDD
jgi:hypothetical protein